MTLCLKTVHIIFNEPAAGAVHLLLPMGRRPTRRIAAMALMMICQGPRDAMALSVWSSSPLPSTRSLLVLVRVASRSMRNPAPLPPHSGHHCVWTLSRPLPDASDLHYLLMTSGWTASVSCRKVTFRFNLVGLLGVGLYSLARLVCPHIFLVVRCAFFFCDRDVGPCTVYGPTPPCTSNGSALVYR